MFAHNTPPIMCESPPASDAPLSPSASERSSSQPRMNEIQPTTLMNIRIAGTVALTWAKTSAPPVPGYLSSLCSAAALPKMVI